MGSDQIHVFERAGLGIAPFAFVGVSQSIYQACQGAPIQPGGTCAFCLTGIMDCCMIRDSTGKTFVVGSTCVAKTGDKGLITITNRVLRNMKREAKEIKDRARIAATIQRVEDSPELQAAMIAMPHPVASRAADGATFFDYADWMFRNAGMSGKIRMCKAIEAI